MTLNEAIRFVESQREFWYLRHRGRYLFSRGLQEEMHLSTNQPTVRDYLRLAHPDDLDRLMEHVSQGVKGAERIVIDPVRWQVVPGVWHSYSSAAVRVGGIGHDMIHVGRVTRCREDEIFWR